jgi:hypothetical protein
MKLKRLLVLILAFSIAGSVTVFADDAFEWYKGKEVKVFINGQTMKSSGLLINGPKFENTTMIPLRDMAETLRAIVKWNGDKQTVNIYKPNVHISLVQQLKGGSFGTFGQVSHKSKYDFYIFTQIDSLLTKVHSYKIVIEDPNNKNVFSEEKVLKEQKENLWIGTDNISLEFEHLGKYTVKVYMKIEESGEYFLVSEKMFPSISN